MESSDSINEAKNDLHVLLEKQDSQFRALTEVLKDSLNNFGFALDNYVSKLSKSIDEEIDKLNSTHTSGQPEDLNRERLEADTPSSDPNGKRRIETAKLPGNPNQKRIIYQDDDSLNFFRCGGGIAARRRRPSSKIYACGQCYRATVRVPH